MPQFSLYLRSAEVLKPSNFAILFKTYQKISFSKQADCSLTTCFSGPISSWDFRERAPEGYNIYKDQLYRISGSEFHEWLFGPEKFLGHLRNGPLMTKLASGMSQSANGTHQFCQTVRAACNQPGRAEAVWAETGLSEAALMRCICALADPVGIFRQMVRAF